jgi:hypothetical protein
MALQLCVSGKECHRSYRDASRSLRRRGRRIDADDEVYRGVRRIGVYRCELCGAWHVGHCLRPRKRRMRRRIRRIELEYAGMNQWQWN